MADKNTGVSRREFVTGVGGAGAGLVLGGLLVKGFMLPDKVMAVPASNGYLLVDTKKCAGCLTCMIACSLAHEGEASLSLSRIQVIRNPLAKFPDDIIQQQCRQCVDPACVRACPTGANHIDAANGNVRTIDESKCIGCEKCVNACPFTPSRVQWNNKTRHAQKCDLCTNAPFWQTDGGIDGDKACATLCPMHAITFTRETPVQGDAGYHVNLRPSNWNGLTFLIS